MAIQSLVYLAGKPVGYLATPQEIADRLQESPSYLSKVLRLLTRDAILRSRRGKSGGFEMVRSPKDITLLDVVESCEGLIAGNYCQEVRKKDLGNTCGYHMAMTELQEGMRSLLRKHTIAKLLATQAPVASQAPRCKMRLLRDKQKK